MKKLFSLFIVLTMIISMAATVDAAQISGKGVSLNCDTSSTSYAGVTPVQDPVNSQNNVAELNVTSDTSYSNELGDDTRSDGQLGVLELSFDLYIPTLPTVDKAMQFSISANATKSTVNFLTFDKANIDFYTTACPVSAATWYTIKIVVDGNSKKADYYLAERGNTLEFKTTANMSGVGLMNNGGTIFQDSAFKKSAEDLKILIDNFESKIYEEVYTAFNDCTTPLQAKAEVDLYESLGLFDGGDKRAQYDDEALYSSLIGKNFTSNAEAQEAYNEVYSALSYGDSSTLYSNWDFENNSLLDSVDSKSFMGENTASYFSIADDPTDASNKVAKMESSTLSEQFNTIPELRADAVSEKIRYAVLDMDLYKEAPQNSSKKNYLRMATGSGSERKSLWVTTNNSLYFNSGIDKDYFDSINNKWLNLRTVIDLEAGEASSYLFYEGEYRKFYSIKENSLSYAGLTKDNALNRISIMFGEADDNDWTAIYLDNVSFKGYTDFYKAVNTAPSALSLPTVTAAYDSADIIDMPDATADMTDVQVTAFFTDVKGTSAYTKDSDVMSVIYKHMADNFADEDDVYLYEYTATANDLYDYTIVLNKDDISETSAVVIAAAYDGNLLLDVASFEYTGSLEKYSAVSVKNLNLDVSGANIVKIFVWDNFGNCVPLVNAVQKKK